MPIYEYRCRKCEQQTEVIQRLSDKPLRRCSACGGRLDKLISRTSFQLKGSGWYAQGYGSSKPKKEASGEAKPKAPESGSGESKSSGDSKGSEKEPARGAA